MADPLYRRIADDLRAQIETGQPMRVTVTIFPVDRQQFIIDVGKVPAPQYEPAKRPA